MKEADGLPRVAVQRYLGGSGTLNYCLNKISKAVIVLLRDCVCVCACARAGARTSVCVCVCFLSAKQKEREFGNVYFVSCHIL